MSKHQRKTSAPPPTIKPGYDLEAYAREAESRMGGENMPPSARPTVSPPPAPEAAPLARGSDVPILAIGRDDLEWFELTAEARDLLRQVNGRDTVEALSRLLRTPAEGLLAQLDALAGEGLITWR
jgi:hypothetical protein